MSGETVYSRAADLILSCGWWDGTVETAWNDDIDDSTVCFHIALDRACDSMGVLGARKAEAFDTARAHVGMGLPRFNDSRSESDVLLALKELHVEAGES